MSSGYVTTCIHPKHTHTQRLHTWLTQPSHAMEENSLLNLLLSCPAVCHGLLLQAALHGALFPFSISTWHWLSFAVSCASSSLRAQSLLCCLPSLTRSFFLSSSMNSCLLDISAYATVLQEVLLASVPLCFRISPLSPPLGDCVSLCSTCSLAGDSRVRIFSLGITSTCLVVCGTH